MDSDLALGLGQIVLGVLGAIVLIWTLLLLRDEIVLQKEQIEHQLEAWQFEIYQRIDNRISDLIWRQSEDDRLRNVYTSLSLVEREALEAAQASAPSWGAWDSLSEDEKACYRFIRIFLENLEQMWEVREKGWMSEEMWQKWQGWIEVWCETRYFDLVFHDQRPRLLPGFADLLDETCQRIAESPGSSAAGK